MFEGNEMKPTHSSARLVFLGAIFALAQIFLVQLTFTQVAGAQSTPTASQQLQLSAFAAGTGIFTDLKGGKNLAITAGADLTFLGFRSIKPALEFRGSYPVDSGHISSQKSFLFGPKVEYRMNRLHPYADFLFGRGQINYLDGGFIVGDLDYLSSNTFIYSPGVGLDYDLNHHFAAKADVQFQHWNTPVTPSGAIHPTSVSLGLVYTFDFNRGHSYFQ
jgi:hypothetical protein